MGLYCDGNLLASFEVIRVKWVKGSSRILAGRWSSFWSRV